MTPPTTRNFFALSAIQLNQTIPPLKKEKTARGTVKARPKDSQPCDETKPFKGTFL
jgi:hypothetical protein